MYLSQRIRARVPKSCRPARRTGEELQWRGLSATPEQARVQATARGGSAAGCGGATRRPPEERVLPRLARRDRGGHEDHARDAVRRRQRRLHRHLRPGAVAEEHDAAAELLPVPPRRGGRRARPQAQGVEEAQGELDVTCGGVGARLPGGPVKRTGGEPEGRPAGKRGERLRRRGLGAFHKETQTACVGGRLRALPRLSKAMTRTASGPGNDDASGRRTLRKLKTEPLKPWRHTRPNGAAGGFPSAPVGPTSSCGRRR